MELRGDVFMQQVCQRGLQLIKLLPANCTSRSMKFATGLNVDVEPFQTGAGGGGLHFTTTERAGLWGALCIQYEPAAYAAFVTVPDDARVSVGSVLGAVSGAAETEEEWLNAVYALAKFKADKVELGEFIALSPSSGIRVQEPLRHVQDSWALLHPEQRFQFDVAAAAAIRWPPRVRTFPSELLSSVRLWLMMIDSVDPRSAVSRRLVLEAASSCAPSSVVNSPNFAAALGRRLAWAIAEDRSVFGDLLLAMRPRSLEIVWQAAGHGVSRAKVRGAGPGAYNLPPQQATAGRIEPLSSHTNGTILRPARGSRCASAADRPQSAGPDARKRGAQPIPWLVKRCSSGGRSEGAGVVPTAGDARESARCTGAQPEHTVAGGH